MSVLGSVNVLSIHERYAYDLFSWGDYEGAVGHFLVAETPVHHVLELFPSLAPPEFVPPGGLLEGATGNPLNLCASRQTLPVFSIVSCILCSIAGMAPLLPPPFISLTHVF